MFAALKLSRVSKQSLICCLQSFWGFGTSNTIKSAVELFFNGDNCDGDVVEVYAADALLNGWMSSLQ
jgi:hypothetical protein